MTDSILVQTILLYLPHSEIRTLSVYVYLQVYIGYVLFFEGNSLQCLKYGDSLFNFGVQIQRKKLICDASRWNTMHCYSVCGFLMRYALTSTV